MTNEEYAKGQYLRWKKSTKKELIAELMRPLIEDFDLYDEYKELL